MTAGFTAVQWLTIGTVFAAPVWAQTSQYRTIAPGEVTSGCTQYATDGILGYTTWELYVVLSGECRNAYTFAGNAGEGHPTEIPGGYQVAAPFGANIAGNRPAYWAYSAEAQYDSWVTGKPPLSLYALQMADTGLLCSRRSER